MQNDVAIDESNTQRVEIETVRAIAESLASALVTRGSENDRQLAAALLSGLSKY
jgi:hypothetical protein